MSPLSIAIAIVIASLATLLPLAAVDAPFTYGRWHSSQAGGGGYIIDLAMSPSRPGRMYAALDVSGVVRSDDGGSTWHLLMGALADQEGAIAARDVDLDPRDPDLVLAALGDQWNQKQAGIWRSEDAGVSWQRVAVAPVAGNDAGRWNGQIIARSPQRPDRVVVGTIGQGVLRSEDGGQNLIKVGPDGVFATGLAWDPHHPDRVWLCADALRWTYDHEGTKTFPEIAFDGGLYRSDDGGLSWNRLLAAGPTEIVPDPLTKDLLWGLMDHRPVCSRDGGAHWEPADSGLPLAQDGDKYLSPSAFQALTAGPDFILAGPSKGSTIYRRPAGGGGAWTAVAPTRVTERPYGRSWYRVPGWDGSSRASLVVDPLNPDRWWSLDWFGLYRSEDVGASWDLRLDGIENTCINGLLQDPSDPGVVHLSMHDNGYLRSLDGGASFIRGGPGITNNVKTIALSPREPRRLYATATGTWHWYASDLFVSIDRGDSWIRSPLIGVPPMRDRRCNSVVVDPMDPLHVWLAVAGSGSVSPTSGGVYESRDGGRSWKWGGAGLPASGDFFRSDIWGIGSEIACGPDGTLVVISHDQALVYRRDPDSDQWTRSTGAPAAPPVDIVADWNQPGRFWLLADGVYRSDDGGRSWQQQLALPAIRLKEGRCGHLTLDRAHPDRLAIGTPGGPYLSLDGGESWNAIGERLPNRLGNIVAFAGDRLVVGSTGNGAFWTSVEMTGEEPVAAMPITGPATVAAAEQAAALPVAWARVWQGSGHVAVEDGTLQLAGPGEGSMATALSLDVSGGQLSGRLTHTGDLGRVVVAIEGFDYNGKQMGWNTVWELTQPAGESVDFTAAVPEWPSAVRLQVVVLAAGEGTASIVDLKIHGGSPVFSAPAR